MSHRNFYILLGVAALALAAYFVVPVIAPRTRELTPAEVAKAMDEAKTRTIAVHEGTAQYPDFPPNGGTGFTDLGTFNGRVLETGYVCFGDLCPQNGSYLVRYAGIQSKEECEEISGKPVMGYGWGPVYGGCEPVF